MSVMQQSEAMPASEVIELLRVKIARNPGDLDAGLMLGSVLYKSGDLAASASAFRAVLRQRPDHVQALLLLARTEAGSGNVAAALKVLASARQIDPGNSQVWQVAASLATDMRDWSELFRIGSDWTAAMPESIAAWKALSRACFEESQFSEAIVAYSRVLLLEPGNAAHLVAAARLAIAAQRYDQARDFLDSAKKSAPKSADFFYTLGRLQHMTGELADAEANYRLAIKARPGFTTAYVELGTLCEGNLEDSEVRAIAQQFGDSTVHPEYRVMLGLTLGDALDRRNETGPAFEAWERANKINQKISEQEGIFYRPELVEKELQLLRALFSEPIELRWDAETSNRPRPVFVVGMPRSGTTLIESILASHSEVFGGGELPAMYDIHEELIGVARELGIDAAREMLRKEAPTWRNRYLAALPPVGGETSVVDKQPLNFRSIGLIRLLFPESPIIYLRRTPLDVGLSIYRHKFSKNWPCAHSLSDIGHYYGVHAHTVDYWNERYSDAFLWLDHDRLVNDPQAEIRRLLSFAGLSPQSACFEPHRTKRPIATFSSVQVRQPVTAAFSGRSQSYAKQLAPLREALIRAQISLDSDGAKFEDGS